MQHLSLLIIYTSGLRSDEIKLLFEKRYERQIHTLYAYSVWTENHCAQIGSMFWYPGVHELFDTFWVINNTKIAKLMISNLFAIVTYRRSIFHIFGVIISFRQRLKCKTSDWRSFRTLQRIRLQWFCGKQTLEKKLNILWYSKSKPPEINVMFIFF